MNKFFMRLQGRNLQFFSEADTGGSDGDNNQEEQQEEVITLTEKELQSKIDSEKDKHAQKVWEKKWETESAKLKEQLMQELEEKKQKEVELAKLSESERKEKELEELKADIEKRENAYKLNLQQAQAKADLADKSLPSDFVDLVVVPHDNEQTLANINRLKEYTDKVVNEAIKESAKQQSPKLGGGATTKDKPLGVFGNTTERAKKAQQKYFGKE